MDLAEDALAELDFVIGSVHSYMNMEAAEMTDRLLRALESVHASDGASDRRRLLHRDAYPFDFDAVRKGGRARRWLEINASPERLDLYAPLIRAAKTEAPSSPSQPMRIIRNICTT